MDSDVKEIGEVREMQIEWRILDFLTLSESEKFYRCASPKFSVADVPWQLSLWTNYTAQPEKGISIFLKSNAKRDYPVEYHFGLKKIDNSVEQLISGILKGKEKCSEELVLIEKEELRQRKSELVPSNILTIICTLNLVSGSDNSKKKSAIRSIEPLKLINLAKLSANFKDLFDDKESCDVTLKVKEKEFRAHKSVLMARSSFFSASFRHDMLEKKTGIIEIPDCDPNSFQEFLVYLYSGILEDISYQSAINLYSTSDFFIVKEVKEFCVECLMQCLSVENICDIAVFADQYSETQLFSVVQDFFNKNFKKIFSTPEWKDLLKTDFRLVDKLLSNIK